MLEQMLVMLVFENLNHHLQHAINQESSSSQTLRFYG